MISWQILNDRTYQDGRYVFLFSLDSGSDGGSYFRENRYLCVFISLYHMVYLYLCVNIIGGKSGDHFDGIIRCHVRASFACAIAWCY